MNNINENASGIFSKKKIILIAFFISLSIILLMVTAIFILKINFSQLFESIFSSFKNNPLFASFLSVFLIFGLVVLFAKIVIPYSIRAKDYHAKLNVKQKIKYNMAIFFLTAVTPANFATDPYTIFWLKKAKFETKKIATSLVLFTATLYHVSQMIVTIPSFILIELNAAALRTNPLTTFVFYLINIGILIDIFILFFLLIFCFSNKIHFFISRMANYIKKICHLHYLTSAELNQRYLIDKTISTNIKKMCRDWKKLTIVSSIYVLSEIYAYFLVYVSLQFCKVDKNTHISFASVFNIANVAVTANKFIPTPGGGLTIEIILINLLNCDMISSIQIGRNDNLELLVNNAVLIWRSATIYIPCFIGILGLFLFFIFRKTKLFKC